MIKWTGRNRAFAAGIFVLTALGVLLYLPADFFDYGESVCLSVVLFDQECYGCGMTRGVQHLLHLDLEEAWNYNKLAFIVLPLGVVMVGHQILQWYRS